ncbi:MAG: hypothetical protein COX07_02190 [Bacteroidetes bacterium CG23_combo_of_CG06-09_8_20_14_all_32_9]|nr:MAG: hypothetical protein COX07_02190 [Bacteroidetes bacterium CG23_combo_of_CG06-09_8_20_14_all_32_9]
MATLQELNLNNALYRDTENVSDIIDNPNQVSLTNTNLISTETQSESLVSGEVNGNLIISDGFLRSKNFITGSTGWNIGADGTVEFGNGIFRGSITATTGTVGGWNIDSTRLYSTNIDIDSANERIKSSDYSSGVSGFLISKDLIEATNIVVRGMIKTANFQKGIISAIGGSVLISKGSDTLDEDMTSLD